jgi:MYXO-CTERM domain-containing protein
MRALVVALAITVPSVAHADFPRLGVWKNTVKKQQPSVGVPLTNVSNVLYLNDCAGGCRVSPGFDDSRTNRSSIAETQVTLDAWPYGSAQWDALVQCVRETYLPFNIEIVTDDPGNAAHFEVMVGGSATQLHPQLQGAGGVAPFIDCNTTENNVISFVFANEVSDLEFLCGAVAQEATHVWGLDHEMNPDDPMTYLDLGTLKRFQNDAAPCGEFEERECFCGGNTQNSVQFLNDRFGPANLAPATLAITAPEDRAWVKPGFPVRAELDSQLSFASGELSVDGAAAQSISSGPIAFNAPTNLTAGDHTIEVAATDAGDRTVVDSVTVRVMSSCNGATGCPAGFHCLTGFCLPGANEEGGLGATCDANEDCITSTCALEGGAGQCTAVCDPGDSCPDGFDCINGVCWAGSSGGCSTSTGGGWIFAGLALMGLVIRRRR